jgi:hypothetical protein
MNNFHQLLRAIDFKNGEVVFDDFDEKREDWGEDLLQVAYPKNILFDVGFYASGSVFRLYIIKNNDWENPVFKKSTSSLKELLDVIKEAVGVCVKGDAMIFD